MYSMQMEFMRLRSAAHAEHRVQLERLAQDPSFRQFLDLCDRKGMGADIGLVELRGNDPDQVALTAHWLRRLGRGKVDYRLQIEPGDDLVEMVRFWAIRLGVGHDRIRLHRRFKGRSVGALGAGTNGVLTVRSNDAELRQRLYGWIEQVKATGFPEGRQRELFAADVSG